MKKHMLLEKMQAKVYHQQFLIIGLKNTILRENIVLKKLMKVILTTSFPTILKEKNLCGLNITIPFKQKIIKHLTFN